MKKEIDFHQIPSIMTDKEKRLLHDIARNVEGDIIEIGSWVGGSTILFASGMKNGKVYAIDPHKGGYEHDKYGKKDSFKVFKDNLRKFGVLDRVVPIRETSREAFYKWRGKKVGMIFIDGDHSYDAVKYDVENWPKFLREGGLLVIHDFAVYDGVRKAIKEYVLNRMRFLKKRGSTVVFIKDGKTGFTFRIYMEIYGAYRKFVYNHRNSWYINMGRRFLKLIRW